MKEKIKRFKSILSNYFTEKLFIKIIIDANIALYDFSLACLDFTDKKRIYNYETENPYILLNENILLMELMLHMQISIIINIDNVNNNNYIF